jgi:sortase A
MSTTIGIAHGDRRSPTRQRVPSRPRASERRRSEVALSDEVAEARRTALVLPIAGYALTMIGVVLALFAAYLFGFSAVQAARDQRKLLDQVTGGPAGLAALSGTVPGDGQPAAVLSIPSIGVHQVVVEGTSAADLQSGPGLMPGTAPVGTLGDTVIAGRRSAFGAPFASIGRLRPGVVVTLVSALGTFRYRVTGDTVIGSAGQIALGAQTSAARLALVTSATTFGTGDLLDVRATLIGTAVTAPKPSLPLPVASELSLSGDPSAEVPSLLWGEALVLAIALTVLVYRRSRLSIVTYVVTTPLLIVIALFFFESVSRLLPATI